MKLKHLIIFALAMPLIGCNKNVDVIDVASYVDTSGQHDCSDKIQELINNNPHRTLYFKDGIYLLDHQILTPGNPAKSVDLQLSNYAILKASDKYQVERTGDWEEWQDQYLYMVSLGGLDRDNDVLTPGSVYSLTGGIIDGSGRAAGVEIAGGRETRVQNVSMKGVQVGLRIAKGVNSGSSDADIRDISIICNDDKESYGLILQGSDNTATNIRIGHVTHGVYTNGGSNLLSYVHPLHNGNCLTENYDESVGFEIDNYTQLNNCYSDNFRIAYKMHDSHAFLTDCIAWWFNPKSGDNAQYAIYKAESEFNATFNNFAIGCKEVEDILEEKYPHIMFKDKSITTDTGIGTIHNVHARNRSYIKDIKSEGADYIPEPDSLLAKYAKGETIYDYK
ncbi:MAG: hypothetical protein MJ206_00240 [Bacilli bacterium]|nr:hypothetical protein [Bacilli bacterium]